MVSLVRLQAGGPSPAEYEYVFRRNDERVGVAGVSGGLDWYIREEGRWEDIYSLDFTYRQSLRCLLEEKSVLGSTEDDFSFLRRIVHALLSAAGSGVRPRHHVRYVALTTHFALAGAGVPANPPMHAAGWRHAARSRRASPSAAGLNSASSALLSLAAARSAMCPAAPECPHRRQPSLAGAPEDPAGAAERRPCDTTRGCF